MTELHITLFCIASMLLAVGVVIFATAHFYDRIQHWRSQEYTEKDWHK